jgi:hypothetical protein
MGTRKMRVVVEHVGKRVVVDEEHCNVVMKM